MLDQLRKGDVEPSGNSTDLRAPPEIFWKSWK
jgi:hypothetical protein